MSALEYGIVGTVITFLVILLIGAAIEAWLHGIGFSVFGLKDIKPKYKTRFLIQILALFVCAVASYVIARYMPGGGIVTLLSQGIIFSLVLFAIFSAALLHASIAVVTYAIVTKPNWRPALLSPSICSGLALVIYLGAIIFMAQLIE